jgi:hypothetical protein
MNNSLIMIGQPDSGKSNYLGRLWEDIRTEAGMISFVNADNIAYLEELLSHLLHGSFAPRSDKNIEQSRHDVKLTVKRRNIDGNFDLVVPDVTGELWKAAVANSDLPEEWMSSLEEAKGALLFLRDGSEENHQPLDWVTSRDLLRRLPSQGGEIAAPTQVIYSELLRFLQLKLRRDSHGSRPKVAVLITAWDRVDPEYRRKPPLDYLKKQFPLLAGRIETVENLEIRLFGTSVVGGDLENDPEFKTRFQNGDIKDFGYSVVDIGDHQVSEIRDLTLPLSWLMEP